MFYANQQRQALPGEPAAWLFEGLVDCLLVHDLGSLERALLAPERRVRRDPAATDAPAELTVEAVRRHTDGFGADVCIEAVGNPKVLEQCFFARDLAGTVVLVGVPRPDMTLELPYIEVFGRGGSLKSSWYGDCLPSRDFPMLVELHQQGRLPLDKFVSEIISLDAVEEAFHKMERGEVLRSVVVL